MFRKSMRRQTAGLVLVTLLAASTPAAAAGSVGRHDGGGLWSGVWTWIEALWRKEGSGIDPNGSPGPADQGSGIDPDGPPCATCAGTTPAPGDQGAHIDPDG